jgi:predicted amidohydrolase
MKICLAQTNPLKGDIDGNIILHKKLIDRAAAYQADFIVFPELSLTGYEPTLAQSLAIQPNDERLDVFQKASDDKELVIGVGVPTHSEKGICISMIIFRPGQSRLIYSKKYLHPDEEDFFVHGQNFPVLKVKDKQVGLAICYELSVVEHAQCAVEYGAEIYIASVAKYARNMAATTKRLSAIAKKYAKTVLMTNSVGPSDGDECAGKTGAWNRQGELIAQLNDDQEGILIVDEDGQVTLTYSDHQ